MNKIKKITWLQFQMMKELPFNSFFIVVLNIVNAILVGLQTVEMQRFFDSLYKDDRNKIIIKILCLGLVLISIQVISGIQSIVIENNSYLVTERILSRVESKVCSLNLDFFNDSTNLNYLEKARNGANCCAYLYNVILMFITYHIPYLVYLMCFFGRKSPILAAIIPMMSVPVVFSQLTKHRLFVGSSEKKALSQRLINDYKDNLLSVKMAMETKTIGAEEIIINKLIKNTEIYNKEQKRDYISTNKKDVLAKLVTCIVYLVTLLVLIKLTLEKRITMGVMSSLLLSFGVIIGTLNSMICTQLGGVARKMPFISATIELMKTKQCEGVKEAKECNLEIENVTYYYPNQKKAALKNLSLNVASGETIAIVGENGAGKSTLVKVMTGLVLPQEGTVKIGNISLKDIKKDKWFERISAVFQEVNQYELTISENVSMALHQDEKRIIECLRRVNLHREADCVAKGEDGILGKQFGNIDLSGGQWQRLSIARAIYKAGDILIFDEPTSAIDSVQEKELYERIKEMANGKTTIIVTHRLAMAPFADKVIVLSDGKIIEQGSHRELMNCEGVYKKMYSLQKNQYM